MESDFFFFTTHFWKLALKVDFFFHTKPYSKKIPAYRDKEEEEDLVYTAEMQQFANDISTLPQRTKIKIAGEKTCKQQSWISASSYFKTQRWQVKGSM